MPAPYTIMQRFDFQAFESVQQFSMLKEKEMA